MSYNGIGLSSAKGSGTNGYVQRNMSYVKPRHDHRNKHDREYLQRPKKIRKVDPRLKAHEEARRITVRVMEYEEELLARGNITTEEIEAKCADMRTRLTESAKRHAQQEADRIAAGEKRIAQDKDARARRALGLSDDHVEGAAFKFSRDGDRKRSTSQDQKHRPRNPLSRKSRSSSSDSDSDSDTSSSSSSSSESSSESGKKDRKRKSTEDRKKRIKPVEKVTTQSKGESRSGMKGRGVSHYYDDRRRSRSRSPRDRRHRSRHGGRSRSRDRRYRSRRYSRSRSPYDRRRGRSRSRSSSSASRGEKTEPVQLSLTAIRGKESEPEDGEVKVQAPQVIPAQHDAASSVIESAVTDVTESREPVEVKDEPKDRKTKAEKASEKKSKSKKQKNKKKKRRGKKRKRHDSSSDSSSSSSSSSDSSSSSSSSSSTSSSSSSDSD